ncbi:ABC transporter ATP-binding protein/permease [Sutterella seckii]|uniref:ABC transporter ATP-binding protein/permease n=1 Tax=Sutterella seckii TaxID=1944635 RepID=A0A6I1EPK1_9BURK|nr:SbmA/BacA-like family transporter [Sutterella seckii]KAB7659045.1 ABC transporter ATP-binding protein/permease [Sutterella seckii]
MQRSGLARLLGQYLFSRDRLKLWLLFGIVLGAYVVNIRLAILYNDWNGRFFDALQKVDQEGIYRELFYFIGLAAAIIVLLVWAGYLKDRLILALRRDVTEIFFARWLSSRSAHYLLRESGKEPDNPDQRITEDVRSLTSLAVNLFISLFDSVLTIGSFSLILWNLSGSITLFGITIPGYMFWVCLIYTAVATFFTHLIGRKLKGFNMEAQHMEANLRSALMEKRRNGAAIAGAHAEAAEERGLRDRFSDLLQVLIALIKKQRDLDLFTVGIGQFTHLAPIFFSLPSFFSGAIQLGGVMQIRGAFNDVARSLSWIIFAYDDLAKLSAAYERLRRLEQGIRDADEAAEKLSSERKMLPEGSPEVMHADIILNIPEGNQGKFRALPVDLSLKPGTLAFATGPSGIGKSTLLKVLAGFSGTFTGEIASRGTIVWIPQKPYLMRGTLRSALAYPRDPSSLSDREAKELLSLARLDHLADQLDRNADWANALSGGEQQRIVLLRAVRLKPDILLMDEMTSGLDDTSAERMLDLMKKLLPRTAILLVTHQSALFPKADQILRLA